jgi:hypothetical protein
MLGFDVESVGGDCVGGGTTLVLCGEANLESSTNWLVTLLEIVVEIMAVLPRLMSARKLAIYYDRFCVIERMGRDTFYWNSTARVL